MSRIPPKTFTLRSFFGCDTPEIYEIVEKGKFDAFLIFGWNRKGFVQAIRACWKEKIPVLMRGDSTLNTTHSWPQSFAKCFLYRWFLQRLNGHLYVGKRNKDYLKHYGAPEDRLFFCPHFVDNDFFSGRAEQTERDGTALSIRKNVGIPKDAFVFLFVGKMIPKKRPADFVKAALRLSEQRDGTGIHFLFVGDGPLRISLESLAKPHSERIHFAGFRNQSRMPAFYKASNALVLPSNGDETWGLVVNEAFASGIPAIVSDAVGCAPDLIEEGRTGFTYPVGNVEALVQRMLLMRKAWEEKQEEIQKNLIRKSKDYSIEKAADGLEEALTAILAYGHN